MTDHCEVRRVAANQKFIERVLDRMLPLDISAPAMFSGYSLHLDGKVFALVGDDTLFIKATTEGSTIAGRIAVAPPYPGAEPSFKISNTKLRDHDWLVELVRVPTDALPEPKKRNRRPPTHGPTLWLSR